MKRIFALNETIEQKRNIIKLIELYEQDFKMAYIGRYFKKRYKAHCDHTTIIYWVRKLGLRRDANPIKEQLQLQIPKKKKYSSSTYIPTLRNIHTEYYDFDGQRINQGRKYVDYLKEKHLHLEKWLGVYVTKKDDR